MFRCCSPCRHWLAAVICLLVASSLGSQAPRFKTLTSLKAIQQIKDIVVPLVEPYLQGLVIPDVNGEADTPIGISIDYSITSIVVNSFSFGPSFVTLQEGQGIEVSITSSQASLTTDWSYSASFVHGSGTAADELNIAFDCHFSIVDMDGKPGIKIGDLNVDIESMDITVHGGASWFYQVFVDIFKSKIESSIEHAVSSQLGSVLGQMANKYLQDVAVTFQLGQNLELNYQLVSNPQQHSTYSVTDHLGDLIWLPNPVSCVNEPKNSLPEQLTNRLFTFIISESMGDCFAEALYNNGYLHYLIVPKDVPKSSPIQLNTSDSNIRNIIPNLYTQFPNHGISLTVTADKAPALILSAASHGVTVNASAWVNINVITNSTGYTEVAVLHLDLTFRADVVLTGSTITGTLYSISPITTLKWTGIGPINMDGMGDLVTVFVNFGVKPAVNQLITKGFPIPNISGLQMTNGVVYNENSYLLIGADFQYQPLTKESVIIN